MKKFILFTLMLSFNSHAENSRAPAVLDGSCNLNIPMTFTVVENGKEVVKEKPIEQLQKEQCAEAKKCMNSAEESEMEELKNLEALACRNTLIKNVTTKVPAPSVNKASYDGSRNAKSTSVEVIDPKNTKPVATPK